MPTTIRPAQEHEAAMLGGIGFDAWRSSALGEADMGQTPHDQLRAEYVRFCAQNWQVILVAESDGLPIGWGARENDENYISDLWIAPDAQGTGAGSALLATLENVILAAGHEAAKLETNVINEKALRFYRNKGYSVVWTGEKFAPALGYRIHMALLLKRLNG